MQTICDYDERLSSLPGHKLGGWFTWTKFWMNKEQHMWEPGTKIASIRVQMTR